MADGEQLKSGFNDVEAEAFGSAESLQAVRDFFVDAGLSSEYFEYGVFFKEMDEEVLEGKMADLYQMVVDGEWYKFSSTRRSEWERFDEACFQDISHEIVRDKLIEHLTENREKFLAAVCDSIIDEVFGPFRRVILPAFMRMFREERLSPHLSKVLVDCVGELVREEDLSQILGILRLAVMKEGWKLSLIRLILGLVR